MDLTTRINKRSLIAIIILALASAVIEAKRLPAGILIGGLLGAVNIKALTWSVSGLVGTRRPTGKMIFFSIFRLVLLFLIIAALAYLKLVNIFGILIGFTVVFTFLITEGLKYAKDLQRKEEQ